MKFLHDLWFYEGVYSPGDQAMNRVLLVVFGLALAGIACNAIAFLVRGIKAWVRS